MIKTVIKDGVAITYEEKILSTMPENEMAERLSDQSVKRTPIMPLGCIAYSENDTTKTFVLFFQPQLRGDGIIHPSSVFVFKINKEYDSIDVVYTYYTPDKMPKQSSELFSPGHRNVYKNGEICLGQAFECPSGMNLSDKINSIVARYYNPDNANSDLDEASEDVTPSEVEELFEGDRWMGDDTVDVSELIGCFTHRGHHREIQDAY